MTPPDPRLGEIEARLVADVEAYNDHGFIGDNQCMTDRDYRLTELRKRDGVIARVEDLAKYLDTLAPGDKHYTELIRAAVTAAKGDGE